MGEGVGRRQEVQHCIWPSALTLESSSAGPAPSGFLSPPAPSVSKYFILNCRLTMGRTERWALVLPGPVISTHCRGRQAGPAAAVFHAAALSALHCSISRGPCAAVIYSLSDIHLQLL